MMQKKYDKNLIHNIINNKKIYYDYYIEKTIESGLILEGWEVKSLREKKVNINNGYLSFYNKELYVVNINIEPFKKSVSYISYQSNRNRKVLLHRKEISFLYGKYKEKGYSLVALSLYWKKSWCKLKIGIAKGKKIQDKRENKKKQDWMIQKNRMLKNY